jgi:putative heme-binding domain-containing protein
LRIQAIHLLGLSRYAEVSTNLLLLLEPQQPQSVQSAVMAALGRFSGSQVTVDLLKCWPTLSPQLRSEAVAVMMRRPERVGALLTAIENGKLAPSDLNATQIDSLRRHRDSGLRQRAIKSLGAAKNTPRQELINSFLPALKLSGNASPGQSIYLNRCASCHRLGDQGHAAGPDLATVKAGGKEKALVNILDPNREVAPNYVNYTVETKDGESLSGIIGNESASSVTLRQGNGSEAIVPRARIARMESTGRSLMPEGLEAGLSPQEMADLLEFIIPLTTEGK